MRKSDVMKRFIGILMVSVMASLIAACVAAIPVAVMYYEEKQKYVATAELSAPAEKVYAAAVSLAEEKELKIVKKDETKLLVEVTDGKQTASLVAEALKGGMTKITVIADIPESKERKAEQQELAIRVIDRVCARLGVAYRITTAAK